MRCPNCRSKMEKGVLQSGKEIIWSSRSLRDKAEDVVVAEKKAFGSKKEAYYCTNCGYLVMATVNWKSKFQFSKTKFRSCKSYFRQISKTEISQKLILQKVVKTEVSIAI